MLQLYVIYVFPFPGLHKIRSFNFFKYNEGLFLVAFYSEFHKFLNISSYTCPLCFLRDTSHSNTKHFSARKLELGKCGKIRTPGDLRWHWENVPMNGNHNKSIKLKLVVFHLWVLNRTWLNFKVEMNEAIRVSLDPGNFACAGWGSGLDGKVSDMDLRDWANKLKLQRGLLGFFSLCS